MGQRDQGNAFHRVIARTLLLACALGAACSTAQRDPWADEWAPAAVGNHEKHENQAGTQANVAGTQVNVAGTRANEAGPQANAGTHVSEAGARANEADAGAGSGCGAAGPRPDSKTYASWLAALDDANAPILGFTLPPVLPRSNVTVRQVAHLSLGGDAIRIRLSNRYGVAPISFDSVHVATSLTGGSIDPSTDTVVTFDGMSALTLAPQAEVWSDEIDFPVAARDNIAISSFVPGSADIATEHRYAQRTNYVAFGDTTSMADMKPIAAPITSSYWLGQIDVVRSTPADVVVAFGDSITDGNNSTSDANLRYPDQLSNLELGNTAEGAPLSIVNAGIGGNRWLHSGLGDSGAVRFTRDALDIAGVRAVVIMMGINDIGFGMFSAMETVTADQITAAIADAARQARSRGLAVFLGTLLPFKNSLLYTADGEVKRQAVNAWIRSNADADAVIDFDQLVRDPADATLYDARYDSGDHLHPNDLGYAAMANAVHAANVRDAIAPCP